MGLIIKNQILRIMMHACLQSINRKVLYIFVDESQFVLPQNVDFITNYNPNLG